MSLEKYKKIFLSLLFVFILAFSFNLYIFPSVKAQTAIWDSCQSLSGSGFVWISSPSSVSLSIDSSVKSPLGTGSIMATVASGATWDAYVVERFSADASSLKDFTAASPSSLYVQGSSAVTWRVEVVTREPSGYAWNVHVVAEQTVPANTMTQIQLNYAGIPSAALQMVAQVSVIPVVAQQSFTGYISGITVQGSGSQPTPQPNPSTSGIWDSCESLSSSNRDWYTSAAGASLSIDTSVKSSLGTGSVRVDISASNYYDLYVQEWFGQSPAVLSDFTAARPEGVFVEGSRAVDWRIEIVTREPSGYAWNVHVVAEQTVPAWTLTEIQLDYSGISAAALQMAGAVSVIPVVSGQSFTGYISGITGSGSTPSPQPNPQPQGPSGTWDPSLGWDFESHTWTHPDLTTLSAAQIGSELQQVNNAFIAHGYPAPTQFAYPYGSYNSFVESIVAQYYKSGRGHSGSQNYYPVGDWYAITALEIRRTTDWATIQGWVDTSIASQTLLQISTHDVSSDQMAYQYPFGCTPEILNQLLAYLVQKQNAGQLNVMTMAQAYDYWSTSTVHPKATVVVCFDDSHETDYTAAYPLFKQYGIKGTSYLQGNMIGLSGRISWSEIAMMRAGL